MAKFLFYIICYCYINSLCHCDGTPYITCRYTYSCISYRVLPLEPLSVYKF